MLFLREDPHIVIGSRSLSDVPLPVREILCLKTSRYRMLEESRSDPGLTDPWESFPDSAREGWIAIGGARPIGDVAQAPEFGNGGGNHRIEA